MRKFSIVLYTACLGSTSAAAAMTLTTVNIPIVTPSFAINHESISTKRLLRIREAEGEERVINAGVEKLTELIKAGASKVSEWFGREKSAGELLNLFKLENNLDAALVSPKLDDFAQYLNQLSTKNPNSKVSLIGTLTAHHGDDAVANSLEALQKNADTPLEMANKAKQLHDDQLSAWLNNDKSVVDVFNLLKLREDKYKALSSGKFKVLEDYLQKFSSAKSADETLLQVLTNGFGGERRLGRVLVVAKADDQTRKRATELQTALLNKWLHSEMSPESVLSKLRLGDDLDNALTDLNRYTLSRFISMYNKKNPSSKTSLVGTFTAHYGDDVVAKILVTASTHANTERIAKQSRTEQLTEWRNSQKSVDDVFTLLKLGGDGYLALTSRLMI